MNNRLLYQYILLLISIINSDDSRLFLSLILIFMNQSSIGDIRVRREARGALNRALRSQWRPPRRPIRNFPPLCQPYQFLDLSIDEESIKFEGTIYRVVHKEMINRSFISMSCKAIRLQERNGRVWREEILSKHKIQH